MQQPAEPLMMPTEVAQLFRVRPQTVLKWARRGRIQAIKTPGGRGVRFHPHEIKSLMDSPAEAAEPSKKASR